jgi:peroxiredoxin Q/BCP
MPLIGEGKKAPSFSATNHDGKRVSLSDFAGKYVLLWWYPKADTPG